MKKPHSLLMSVLKQRCPNCREGHLFKNQNPYYLKEIFDMPEYCQVCHQKVEIEPGFFYGAMYVSYAVTIAWLVAVWVAFVLVWPGFTILQYLILGIGSMILLQPVFFRISRSIWSHMFVSYRSKK
jgi:uncharacterized protein (DUF983 family)